MSVIWEMTTKEDTAPAVKLLSVLKSRPKEVAEEKDASLPQIEYEAAAKAG